MRHFFKRSCVVRMRNDTDLGPANLLHASAQYSGYNKRFDFALPVFFCRKIFRALRLLQAQYWVGLSDKQNEGYFRWVNGHRAERDDVTLWRPNEPDGGADHDCVSLFIHSSSSNGYLAGDGMCSWNYRAICEKLI